MTTINNSENLIEKVGGIEKAREIVEGAPGRAEVCIPCLEDVMYFAKRDDGKWFKWSNGYNQWLEYFGKVDPMDLAMDLNDLRTAIVEHDREFKIGDHIRYMGIDRKSPHPEIFEVVGFDSMPVGGNGYKIKNRLGQIDFCYGDNYALVDCDNTNNATDIRNHVSPSTKLVDL
ncbi:hypothetical protein [Acinetobacter sp. ULE_I037]|uniref:hypothetical protein n=1 Tax=unclassified Acinetobacter TaxID=196816 RepID=UPI003AF71BBD